MKSVNEGKIDYTTEVESQFIQDFIVYWEAVRSAISHYKKLVSNQKVSLDLVKIIRKTCEDLFLSCTQPFFEKWCKVFPFIQKDSGFLSLYWSYEISFNNFSYLLPHKLVVFELFKCDNACIQNLKRIKKLEDLLFYLTRTFCDLNLNLNSNDKKILNYFTSKDFVCSYKRFPTQKRISDALRISEATYNRRESILAETYVFSAIYRLNISALGFETLFVCSPFVVDNAFLTPSSLASVPYRVTDTIGAQKIIQYQVTDYNLFQKITSLYQDKNSHMTRLTNGYIGWNLHSFHHNSSKRWKVLPPILSTYNWDDGVISEEKGFHYNLIPQSLAPHLTEVEREILAHFSKYGTRYDVNLAKKFGKTEKYIRRSWSRLLSEKLVHRFPLFSNIGLDAKPWITLFGRKNGDYNKQNSLILRIVEHLKLLPFTFIFYKLAESSKGDPPLLAGLIYIPSFWMTEFNIKWNKLAEFGFLPEIEYSYNRYIRWNIDITKVSFGAV